MKPTIGITGPSVSDESDPATHGQITLNWNYAEVVAEAGGVPLIVPPTADPAEVARLLDGWLITGGADLDPALYGEEPHPETELCERRRTEAELKLLEHAHVELPIFGICYGCQFLNVARGGSLHQHLPDLENKTQHTGNVNQEYRVAPGSRLAQILGAAPARGASSHHQGIARLGQGLRAVAEHCDGTIEAIEDPDHPWFIGVQWHPERTPDDPCTLRLFASFVQAAKTFAQGRRAC